MPIILLAVIHSRSKAEAKWFGQKVTGHLGQARPDTILEHPDHLFYLPIGLTVANGDVVMDNAQPFAQLCKAAHKLSAIVSPDVAWPAPMGNQVTV